MTEILVSSDGRGKELAVMLMREFNIPPTVQRFKIEVGLHDAITIDCVFLAYEDKEDKGGET
jgi:hypothetical protein